MNKDSKISAQHQNNGTLVDFTLVATPLKRVREGEAVKYYPWFSEAESTWDNLVGIFGDDMLKEMALDALQREFQMLYFQRSPTGEQVPVIKDGKPATLEKDGKVIPVTQEDTNPNIERFLAFIKDENLSGREITHEYCMRKAINIQTGVDKKWKDRPDSERMSEAMKWLTKAQEMMVLAMSKANAVK